MRELRPTSERDLCDALAAAASSRSIISMGGTFSKVGMGAGPAIAPEVVVSTSCMRRVLNYEPRDLTISVEAGMPFGELSAILAEHRQMVPLDPPYFERATVGGVLAANTTGPRRRLYGSVRDMVIGISFAKLDGKLAKSGGMVVKNVAGFDIAKLMIGSFGTLAVMSSVNFKLSPMPPESRTFLMQFDDIAACLAVRDRILQGVLQPAAVDLLNPAASKRVGLEGYALLLQAGGSPAVMARYGRELAAAEKVDGEPEQRLWASVREFTPQYVSENSGASVARVVGTHSQIGEIVASTSSPVVSRAASGIAYLHFDGPTAAQEWKSRPAAAKWRYVFDYGAAASNEVFGSGFEMMQAVKNLFDPDRILNPGRLYGRI